MQEKRKAANILIYSILTILSVIFIIPIALVIMNSLKNKLYISTSPFALPDSESFRGLKNYIEGLTKIHFMDSIGYSLFITVVSVIMIIVFCSMTAWYITRVKNKLTSFIYFLFIASMVVPFQMVMYTMTKVANMTHLDNFIGINVLYLGFGSSMAVFMFTGFKADLHHHRDPECNVDLERLPASVSDHRYEVQDHTGCDPVSEKRLRLH